MLFPLWALIAPLAAPPVPEVQAVVASHNQFALDLYQKLAGHDGNLFFSPYSIDKVLTMAWAGARGDTAQEMAAALHVTLAPEKQHRAFAEMRRQLNARRMGLTLPGKQVQLRMAAELWGQQGYGFQRDFLSLTRDFYGAGLEEVDFHNPEAARRRINAWVDQQTQHKIAELFAPGVLDLSTRLVLASAIYFKGDWVHQFKKHESREEVFHVAPGREARTTLMRQTETFGYAETPELQILQMPYVGQNLALVVLLPRRVDGLAALEQTLTANQLTTWLGQLPARKVDVTLPKFQMDTNYELKKPLADLGIRLAFSPGQADFAGMNRGQEPLYLSAVVHKAFVDVNEEGTEAAAATGAAVAAMAMPTQPVAIPVFRADHPFLFAIRDVHTGVLLFLGRLTQP
jgi:serpin B